MEDLENVRPREVGEEVGIPALAAGQRVHGDVAGERIGESVAGEVEGERALDDAVLDIGAQRVAKGGDLIGALDRSHADRINSRVNAFGHAVIGIVGEYIRLV